LRQNPETKAMKYNLDKIREAAKKQKIEYRGGRNSNVRKTIANLGYTFTDVINCITSLSPSNFLTTYEYPDKTFDDGYIIKLEHEEIDDEIFMKLRLLENGDIEIVEIGSFHLTKR
jgi:hypothetical protein